MQFPTIKFNSIPQQYNKDNEIKLQIIENNLI